MYVKLFSQILDSSIADNRKLRHFFTDLLLCADQDGNVVMTEGAIARRIGAELGEVEWGLEELSKPDPRSRHSDEDGRRIVRLDGFGYGWRIVNYGRYRSMKTSAQMREENNSRVQRHRAKKAMAVMKKFKASKPLPGETTYERILEGAGQEAADAWQAGSGTPVKPDSMEGMYQRILATCGKEAADEWMKMPETGAMPATNGGGLPD